ncbi:hypothetical protein JXO52_06455 [bacterium]|nr:hypothetical protein [bacterium]
MKSSTVSRKSIVSIAVELVLILVAVLLGLIVNEMRLNQNERQRTEKILGYIVTEFSNNGEQLTGLIPYHMAMSDSLQRFAYRLLKENRTDWTYEDISQAMPRGFRVPILEQTGWELLNNTGSVNNIDLELAVELSKIYNLQVFLQRKLDKVADNMYVAGNSDPDAVDNMIIALGFLINDILVQEKRLAEKYPLLTDMLKERLPRS